MNLRRFKFQKETDFFNTYTFRELQASEKKLALPSDSYSSTQCIYCIEINAHTIALSKL